MERIRRIMKQFMTKKTKTKSILTKKQIKEIRWLVRHRSPLAVMLNFTSNYR